MYVALALPPTGEQAAKGWGVTAEGAEPHRVLLVDDVESYRGLLRMVFEADPDYEVIGEAANGKEAIHETRRLHPDLILLDISMPVMDGLDALPAIRKASPSSLIVMCTGFEEVALGAKARDRGADAFLEKGMDPMAFLEALKKLIKAGLDLAS